ncbi:SH3 domain-containing protein [Aspergillus sp. HF37]|nr:SH3 domain-containing protein [Aspergillus sp. HF37]
MPKHLHNPFASSLQNESKKASQILEEFVNPSRTGSPGTELPSSVLANAKGLLVFTIVRAGFLGSARSGSGVMIARLHDGRWSPPSAVAMAGVGFGGQCGFEITDFVFVLSSTDAVHTFMQRGSLMLGPNISLAFGPVGRSAEVDGAASSKGAASMYAYCKTKGLYGGLTIEGGLLVERRGANRKLYNQNITAKQLLSGGIASPHETEPLMRVLASEAFHPADSASSRGPEMEETVHELPAETQTQPPSELHGESQMETVSELPAEAPNHSPSELHAESQAGTAPESSSSGAQNQSPSELHGESQTETVSELPAEVPNHSPSELHAESRA